MTNQFIPYGRQHITQTDIDAVVAVLQSDFWPKVVKYRRLKNESLPYGAKFGVAVNSATSALHIACLALGLGQGERAKMTGCGRHRLPLPHLPTVDCTVVLTTDFVDIDPLTLNMSINALAEKLQLADAETACQNSRSRAFHRWTLWYGGHSCAITAIWL